MMIMKSYAHKRNLFIFFCNFNLFNNYSRAKNKRDEEINIKWIAILYTDNN